MPLTRLMVALFVAMEPLESFGLHCRISELPLLTVSLLLKYLLYLLADTYASDDDIHQDT